MDFKNIKFQGKFRDYQQRVLDNMHKHIGNKKINIVAAPGSGKTVLGLEIIRRLNAPCIIFSPTTAIREQWGDRFKELFLEDEKDFDKYFSTDLHDIKLLNSVTYQALYSAMEKAEVKGEDEVDCSDVDVFETIKNFGITTICLDEAHHLKNEWQKTLEKFIKIVEKDVKIVSLTATPPYDSEQTEWKRYIDVCGEIDEEIFVPELVATDTLCPHQDYIYFNYPTETEIKVFKNYKENVASAIAELKYLDSLKALCENINQEKDYSKLFTNAKEYIALLVLFNHFEYEIDKKIIKALTTKTGLPSFKLSFAEMAVQFVIDGNLLAEADEEELVNVLKKHSVYEKRKVSFELSDKLKRTLVSSVGKLDSICKIVKSESEAMGKDLRMLVLTDYIQKETIKNIVTEKEFTAINIVSIFENIRRLDTGLKLGVLSGTLVILPNDIDLSGIKHKKSKIEGTDYSCVDIAGSNHDSVDFVGGLFASGKIQILVGTKSLLGEGWDSPCINSLILASFVGSFVQSNQMRGRAIRVQKGNPDKVANIWHLVTVEPDYVFEENAVLSQSKKTAENYQELKSYDYEVLKRRFDSFMGPNYETGKIESGIDRISIIKPPYSQECIAEINNKMIELSKARAETKEKWLGQLEGKKIAVVSQTEIPKDRRVPVFTFKNFALIFLLTLAEVLILTSVEFTIDYLTSFEGFLVLILQLIVLYLFYLVFAKIVAHYNPARSIKTLGKCVYKTLRDCDIIETSTRVEVKEDKLHSYVSICLKNATIHEQNLFNNAMAEMLSPIENPRFILIMRSKYGKYNYKYSFACPSIIGKKKEYAIELARYLKNNTGNFDVVFSHNETGREFILKCRRHSYITYNHKVIDKKYKVSNLE